MEFRVLGPLEVVEGDRTVPIGRRKQRALLGLLLLHPNEALAPDRLIEDLWSGRPPARAGLSLQAYVSNLRRMLDPARAARGPDGPLALQPGGYVLAVDPQAIDAGRFERLLADARSAGAAGDHARAESIYEQALGLWRGDVLADLAHDLPPQPAVARLQELRLSAIEEKVAAGLAAGRHHELVSELDALVMQHPLRERLREHLAIALYRSGRQADALEQLRSGRAFLVEQLGLEPGPALQRLEQSILRQSEELEWRATRAEPAGRPGPAPATAAPDRFRLVGREAELARLEEAWEAAASGRGRVVLIGGEPGIGKTRLAEELASHVAAEGGAVYWGRSFEVGGAPTFWPWVQTLSEVVEDMGAEDLRRLLGPRAGTLAQLVPEIGRRLESPAVTPGVDAAEARFQLYDAVTRFVLRLASTRPLLVVLDDLHWADPPSLDLLRLLAARLREARVLLLATYRDTAPDRSDALGAVLAGLAREAPLDRLGLQGLGVTGVSEFLDDRLGSAGGDDLARRVHERTSGNPFFVSELVQLMVREHGTHADVASADVWRQVPDGVREVIERRVGLLPAPSAEVLDVGAVIGRDFTVATLHEALSAEPLTVLDAIEPAVAAGLVVPVTEAGDAYRFAHALVRETVYEGLPTSRRASLHGAVAAVLESRYDDRRSSEIAHHYEQALAIGYADRAIDALVRAADQAQRVVAFEPAEAHLRRALEILERYPDGPRELAVLSRLAALLVMTRGYTASEIPEVAERVRGLAERVGDAPEVADVMWARWTYECVSARFGTALEAAEEIVDRGRRTGDRAALAAGLQARGTSLWHVGRISEAVEALRASIAAAGELDDDEFRRRSLQHPSLVARSHASHALWLLGDTPGAERLVEEARVLSDRIGTPYERAFSLYMSAWQCLISRDFPAAEGWCRQALELTRDHGFRQLRAFVEIMLGAAEAHCGRLDEGLERLRDGLEAFRATGSRMLGHFHGALLADALLSGGRVAEAARAVERALEESRATGETFYLSELLRLKAEVIVAGAGDTVEARSCLRQSLEVADRQGARAIAERIAETQARLAEHAGAG